MSAPKMPKLQEVAVARDAHRQGEEKIVNENERLLAWWTARFGPPPEELRRNMDNPYYDLPRALAAMQQAERALTVKKKVVREKCGRREGGEHPTKKSPSRVTRTGKKGKR